MLDIFCLIYRLYKIDTQRRFPAALPLFKGIQASPNASLADQRECLQEPLFEFGLTL